MFKKLNPEERTEAYKNLPQKNKDLLWEEDMDHRIEELANNFKTGKARKERLKEVTLHLLLGVLPPSQIKKALEKELALESEEAAKMASEFVNYIIAPFKETLKGVYDKEEFERLGIKTASQKQEKKEEGEETGEGTSLKEDPYKEPID